MDVNSRHPLQNIIPFRIKGVEIGRFDGSGNLGIGTMTTTATAVRLDISGGAVRANSGSAANTALTTVGRIGVNLTTSPTVDLDVSGEARVNSGSAANTALTTVGRIGVNLTSSPTVDLEVNGSAKIGSVVFNVDPIPLYNFTSHTFTNAGTTGRTGPTLTSVRTAYSGVSWAQNSSYLDMLNNNGIQLWTVPITGSYTIRAVGAAGGNLGTYGKGRDIQTTTTLTKGEVIRILVGQQGVGPYNTRGGGGGTFVVRGTQTPIIVAGGGGGRSETVINEYNNSNASSSTSGNKGGNGEGSNNGAGGTNGGGGVGAALTYGGGGGGGLLTTGGNSPAPTGGYGGASFINGGVGGLELFYNGNYGGFGGGGGSPAGGGGGGGYSGGGGGCDPLWARGGGGGSFTISAMTDYGATNNGHGSVEIILLSVNTLIGVNTATPTVDLDVSGSVKITGNVDMSSTGKIVNLVTPTATQEAATKGYVDGAIPIGGIIMWSGTIATIPSNWRLCDGSNNTPNLTNKFIIGAIIDASSVAQTNITSVNTITGGTKDAVVVQHSHTASSDSQRPPFGITETGYADGPGGYFHRVRIGNVTLFEGLNGYHSHTITVDQQGVSGTNQNLPPYYALAFIMRIS